MSNVMERCCASGSAMAAERAEEAAEAAIQASKGVAAAYDVAAEARTVAREAAETAAEAVETAAEAVETAEGAVEAAAEAAHAASAAQATADGAVQQARELADGLQSHTDDTAAHGASADAGANTIALRGPSGTLSTGAPTEASHAAPREYVDAAIAGAVSGTVEEAPEDGRIYGRKNKSWTEVSGGGEGGGEGGVIGPEPDTLMLRDAGGCSQAESPVEDKDVANKEYVDRVLSGALFAGQITPYHGAMDETGAHPLVNGEARTDWRLCDGVDGTPDLRDRFILGVGGTYAAGDVGGAKSTNTNSAGAHTHTGGAVGATTLSIAQMPSHTHPYFALGTEGGQESPVREPRRLCHKNHQRHRRERISLPHRRSHWVRRSTRPYRCHPASILCAVLHHETVGEYDETKSNRYPRRRHDKRGRPDAVF